ncbi:AVAST type 1 anti-phage system protease Avs1b [Vibrio diabolicus]|uniref:AVAST type 1 anti-phage system protease Avs1b n=1 Tax=Vibrio diabolicus TaxID=50719 RepID=UPI002161061A|nr:AVAST type 1 anti-phage system protease Avs1b [Vibrio diabolicus]MCS0325012.1 serine protease [Vibrio diabolicus]
MLDTEMKVATCKIECGDQSGTGSLITSKIVLTAYHCVAEAIENDSEVSVTFNTSSHPSVLKARILGYDAKLDIALVELEAVCDISPIKLSDLLPLGGNRFYSYGWPASKLTMGHRLEGTIVQTFESPKLGSDIEICIDEPFSLSDYQGFSGAVLVCNDACIGVIRVSVEKTIGVISISRLRDFLNSFGIAIETSKKLSISQHLASRKAFTEQFDDFISAKTGSYIFINGAHGIGKSTFCEAYSPETPSLEYFGTYSFTPRKSSKNATQLAQPQEFFNWLNMQVSMLITSTPGRKETLDYPELINKTEQLLLQLSGTYSSNKKTGILFIDGLDEVDRQDADTLTKLIGLLPLTLPPSLVIVFSAPNYEQFATRLGNRLNRESCISMPSLSDSAVQDFCYGALTAEHANSKTVSLICERVQGHPLYLRYLIDLVNSGTSNDDLENLPLIDGSIRKYYDLLWLKLKEDNDAVNLLAIAVRLRWGISISHFTEILNPNEQAILIGTLGRIQHLLLNPAETTIYHSSFSDFLLEKTALREQDVQLRLAEYCEKQLQKKYCLVNLIYHGLKAEGTDKAHVVALCTQKWIDDCVYQGIEPDTLLEDLKNVLRAATELGSLVEAVRILLLCQRIQFRYNTLFAQSADLTANALISIGKEQEVLQHVTRYGQLVVPLDEALVIALELIDAGSHMYALELLNVVERYLTEALEQVSGKGGLSYSEFLDFYDLQTQQYLLKLLAGDVSAQNTLANFQYYWMKVIDKTAVDEKASKHIRSQMTAYFQAASMCLNSRYMSISQLREFYSGPLNELAESIVFIVPLYQVLCKRYDVIHDSTLVGQVFSDIEALISDAWEEEISIHPSMVDCYISLGAPRDIVLALGEAPSKAPLPISFIAEDNVSIDLLELETGIAAWRFQAFVDPDVTYPTLVTLSAITWMSGIESIFRTIAWCDGTARRFKENEDTIGLDTVWKVLSQDVFNHLRFSLVQRIQWKDAYGLPESIFPNIYQSITELITDIYPSRICDLLNFIEEQFDCQCGIYSEGFRSILNQVLTTVVSKQLDEEVEDQAFLLLDRWKEYVTSNLENRYELIPELLSIIPLYTRLDASDQANKTYQLVLSFSMGPSWYKEDQLGLSITALESVDQEYIVEPEVICQIAGLLDAADGEMTFQRFVRYAKRDFIGALCQRGSVQSAVNYFIRQTYGTLEQMYQEVTRGDIDRVSTLRGTRFPGAALDEQDSILSLITPLIPKADWQLCWALLECFQFGDSRHIDKFAYAYSLLIDKLANDNVLLELALDRVEIICESEFNSLNDRSEFTSSLASNLNEHVKSIFAARFPESIAQSDVDCTKIPLREGSESDNSEVGKNDSDTIYFPGTFGNSNSIEEANVALSNASRHLRRKNNSEAKKEIILAMNAMQNGGWSLWNGTTSVVEQGKSLLLQTDSSVSDLVKLLSPLIVGKRYAESWRIAESLITWLASHCPYDEQAQLLKLTNEHTSLMVGSLEEADRYTFLENDDSLSDCLAKLILHVIEHPTWLRREKASEMLIWLSKSYPGFVQLFGAKAFSMNSGSHPDLICGALEQTSISQQAWEALAQELDFNSIQQNCKHVGRYSVLVRIARQAAVKGSNSAEEALDTLTTRFNGVTNKNTSDDVELPTWAECIRSNWPKLKKLDVLSASVLAQAESILQEICLPLSIEASLELEQLLAEGYYGNVERPNRWLDKVRYAFQVALHNVAEEPEYKHIEAIFRKYNPTRLDNLRITNFESQAINWIRSKEPTPAHGDSIYLDYCERVWLKDQLRLVRLTAYLTDSPENLPLPSGRFLSTDKPSLDKTSLIDTCANVEALPAYFGSFTPAIPTTHFMNLTGASISNLKRGWWKSGRLKETYEGAPIHEGCFLSIDSNALRLPHGFSLIWVFELDLEPIGLISFG